MGLTSKEVSRDGHGWSKALMQGTSNLELIPKSSSSMKKHSSSSSSTHQSEPLKCPRCDSTNTKFCYYNNYNKSQPRHFCKACKRHWTKGGTLRNVPVGGGRKNKRKMPAAATKANSKTTTTATTAATAPSALMSGFSNANMTIQPKKPRLTLPLETFGGVGEKNLSEAFYQTLGRQPFTESSLPFTTKCMNEANNGIYLDSSSLSVPPQKEEDLNLNFPYSTLMGSFDHGNPCSISAIQSSNIYNYTADQGNNSLEETMINTLNTNFSSHSMSMTEQNQESWSMAATVNNSNWDWDDLDVDTDLGIPWEDADNKP